jgi:hypothetical protein
MYSMGLIDLQLGALHFSSICNPAVCSLKFLENAEMAGRSLWCILELVIHQMIILQKEYVYPLFPPFNTAFFCDDLPDSKQNYPKSVLFELYVIILILNISNTSTSSSLC